MSTTSASPSLDRVHPGQGEQRVGEAADPIGVLGEPAQKVIERPGIVLRASEQDLDRAGDPGDRVAELVRGIGDELALGDLPPQLLGAVADDEQDGVLDRARAPQREHPLPDAQGVAVRPRRAAPPAAATAPSASIGRAVHPDQRHRGGLQNRTSPPSTPPSPPPRARRGSRTAVSRSEDSRSNDSRSARAHRVQRPPQVADLVAAAAMAPACRAGPRRAARARREPLQANVNRLRRSRRSAPRSRPRCPAPSAAPRSTASSAPSTSGGSSPG